MSNQRRARRDPWQRAPCGCAFRVRGDTFLYQPCSEGCLLWRYTVRRAAKLGKPLGVVLPGSGVN